MSLGDFNAEFESEFLEKCQCLTKLEIYRHGHANLQRTVKKCNDFDYYLKDNIILFYNYYLSEDHITKQLIELGSLYPKRIIHVPD